MKTIFLVRWSASRVSITLPYNLNSVIKSVLCLGVDVSPGLQDIIVSYFLKMIQTVDSVVRRNHNQSFANFMF